MTSPAVTTTNTATSEATGPPYYILLSQSSLPPCPTQRGSSSLVHPIIEYQYADDPPSVLLPSTPGESVIVLDCTGTSPLTGSNRNIGKSFSAHGFIAESLSPGLAVAALKVVDAPGVTLNIKDGQPPRNGKMFIIETVVEAPDGAAVEESAEMINAQALIAQFKQRNNALKRVVDAQLSLSDDPVA